VLAHWRARLTDALAHLRNRPAEALARRRVPLGFVAAVVALIVADPTWASWFPGLAVALVGEAIRIWAAGHLEKSREVTRSGPYRWTRHPLYVGSGLIALGVVIAARHPVVTIVTLVYMVATLTAAIRTEEAFLSGAFGDIYDRYRASAAHPMARRFSLTRAVRNREHRAATGLLIGFGLLAMKVMF
jgi:protein-S-isoprenylcysteine O-methyltransferase Ste14